MKKLMLLVVLLVGMVLVQGCKEDQSGQEIYYSEAEEAQIKAYNTVVEEQQQETERQRLLEQTIEARDKAAMEREDHKQERPVIPVDDCAKIGIFLIQHSEFGSYKSLSSIEFIGNLPPNGKAYNVPLANGRTLQFIFRNNEIVFVGEEVPGGYIAHYGRM